MPEAQIKEPGALAYRADIDGLRAVAVVPVVLYHYGITGFSGGFVGVDIFFVISGFLITSLIAAEMRAGHFSILGFYERRARRILPALFAVLAVSAIAAVFILFPRDLASFGESLGATALFGSNFDFWLRSGYFDAGADLKPLLHTWSLAVEEQYYLLFPALLYALHARGKRALLALVTALAVLSFALSLWGVALHPSAAFYLAPYRTWELMLGAMLALAPLLRTSSAVRTILALAGVALIVWPVMAFTAATPFPGLNALYPCAGAALLIFAGMGESNIVSRALSWRPIVFVGLISYSLYLWHWPLYVFAHYLTAGPLSLTLRIALIAASFGLAYLSWQFVERPFRLKRHLFTRPRLFRLAGTAMAGGIVIGVALIAAQGLPGRFDPGLRRILAEADDFEPLRRGCFNISPQRVARGDVCAIGDATAAAPTFILWGDSHADALVPVIAAVAQDQRRKGLFIAHGRCPPLLDVRLSDERNNDCARLNDEMLQTLARDHISEVIMGARWAYYEQGRGVGVDAATRFDLHDVRAPAAGDNRAVFARLLSRTIQALTQRGIKVILVGDVAEPGVSVPEAMARAVRAGGAPISVPRSDFDAREADVSRDFAALQLNYPLTILEPSQSFCDAQRCVLAQDGRPLYFDDHHLSQFGALTLKRLFASVL